MSGKRISGKLIVLLALAILSADANGQLAPGNSTLTVTTNADLPNGSCQFLSSTCSLRAAIIFANSLPPRVRYGSVVTIQLPALATGNEYLLQILGQNEGWAWTGDLDVQSHIVINGGGKADTIINAIGISERVFEIQPGWSLTLSGVTVKGGRVQNPAKDIGGGILIQRDQYSAGNLVLVDSDVTDNTIVDSRVGGGIGNFGNATLIRSRIFKNSSDIGGGGIYNGPYGNLTITDTTIDNNSAINTGGGLYNVGAVTADRSTFNDNSARRGGGVFHTGNALTLTNSTISGNKALFADGGGLFSSSGFTLFHVTAAFNTSGVQTGTPTALYMSGVSAVATLKNSLISEPGKAACGFYLGSTISQGYNLEDGNRCGLDPSKGDVNTFYVGLGPLASNGGFTQTHALLPGSFRFPNPAIDRIPTGCAGCLPADQRGVARPSGYGIDIGAFEYEQFPILQPWPF
ncbi:MAG TPA: choice-of-anchor Q domain-containing protein [Terriglobia bacterium]|nr:choice-of-anchor Q domain-containing protein [Terriglobia bacterium]